MRVMAPSTIVEQIVVITTMLLGAAIIVPIMALAHREPGG